MVETANVELSAEKKYRLMKTDALPLELKDYTVSSIQNFPRDKALNLYEPRYTNFPELKTRNWVYYRPKLYIIAQNYFSHHQDGPSTTKYVVVY